MLKKITFFLILSLFILAFSSCQLLDKFKEVKEKAATTSDTTTTPSSPTEEAEIPTREFNAEEVDTNQLKELQKEADAANKSIEEASKVSDDLDSSLESIQ